MLVAAVENTLQTLRLVQLYLSLFASIGTYHFISIGSSA